MSGENEKIEWLDVSANFGSAMPHGSCNAAVEDIACGFPRRADGTCINGHPAQPVPGDPS